MPSKRPFKRRPEDDDRSPARGAKRAGKNKREQTYDTYDEAMDGGVEMEEKGERYRDGEKAQRFYERAIELYQKAFEFQQTYDAAYNRARALYTLSTSFLLPPRSVVQLSISIELYRLSKTLTDSSLLQMDAAYNLAQAMTDLAEMLEDLEGDARAEEIRRLREEARTVLEMVLQGQEEYLRLTTEAVDVEAAEEAVDEVEGGAEMDMDDPPGDEGDATTTYETHLPTPSALLDTALALIDIHLSLWESTVPSRTPTNSEQSVVRSVLDRAAATTPPGRQAELDLAEIKVLLSMDGIVWDLFKSEARIGTGVEKSLEGAVAALEALLTSLDVYPPDEQTVRTDILTTLADTHSTIASRLLFLTPQLPPGPSPLAQQAWFHFSQAVTRLSTALDLPTSASTPRLFKTSVLLSLSKASLSRAKLAELNETAQRNASQLMENATTYSARASEALGRNATTLPYPAGWVAELIARNTALQQLRVCFYGSKPDLVADAKERYASRAVGILERLKGVRDEERRVRSADVERWITEIQEEGGMEDEEREWWKEVAAGLGE